MHAQHLREGGGEPKIILYKITTEMIIVKSLLEFQFCMMKCSILISFHLKNNVYIFISHLFAFTNMGIAKLLVKLRDFSLGHLKILKICKSRHNNFPTFNAIDMQGLSYGTLFWPPPPLSVQFCTWPIHIFSINIYFI